MESFLYVLRWYGMTLVIGLSFFGITKKLFSRFFDHGYAFSRTLGILVISYGMFFLASAKIAPFHLIPLWTLIGTVFILGYRHIKKKEFSQWRIYLLEEIIFFCALLFWSFIRSQEPTILSLEKLMDFGFINSILRSEYFPPLDMWFAKLPINYYYFGHLTGAIQIKLSGVPPQVGYNLILATIFALSIISTFSLVSQIVYSFSRKLRISLSLGALGSLILNFGGNLHTLYLFTSGYPVEKPIPFWEILSGFNPSKYWYPNATRFIPLTIHEFPSYSYVVADLHGHVFDIPFVLLTLALLFLFFTNKSHKKTDSTDFNRSQLISTLIFSFLTAIHYMTNAFDGPIYLLLCTVFFVIVFKLTTRLFTHLILLYGGFFLFSLPFSLFFKPFATGIGLNCSPNFLVTIGKIGPFLFEKGNCQPDPLWMLFILWGFFWISFILFVLAKGIEKYKEHATDDFVFVLFSFGTFLVLIPEFFYIKDIYPAHFRANTMFKLGYQAFMMMSIASIYSLFVIVRQKKNISYVLKAMWFIPFILVIIYSLFSIPSYYGNLQKKPQLDGIQWLEKQYPESAEIVSYINTHIKGQPVILEAQGDSYSNFNHISSYTGIPTVAGWWVHEWLWRGTPDAIGKRIPDVVKLYESKSLSETKQLLKKYDVSYVVVSQLERQKYPNLNEEKFRQLGKKIFESKNGFGALYQLK